MNGFYVFLIYLPIILALIILFVMFGNRRILDHDHHDEEHESPAVHGSGGGKKTAVTTPSGRPDDLTRIKGIGKVIQNRLNDLGITTFDQIAGFTRDDIERVDGVLDFVGRIEREQWVDQARSLLADRS